MMERKDILLVEDDRLDIKNVERAFRENGITHSLYPVHDGEEALAFLRNEAPFEDRSRHPRPDLIMLDLNMPYMNGIEFLRECRSDADLKSIPVVVLTTSAQEQDVVDSYELGVAGYIVKPVDFRKFVDVVSVFDSYWRLCETP